jgi:hypothetical protein
MGCRCRCRCRHRCRHRHRHRYRCRCRHRHRHRCHEQVHVCLCVEKTGFASAGWRGGKKRNRENKAPFFESRSRLDCSAQSSRLRLSKNAALFSRLCSNATVKIKPHSSKAVAGLTAARSEAGYGFRKMRLCFHGCVLPPPVKTKCIFLSCMRTMKPAAGFQKCGFFSAQFCCFPTR